MSATRPQSILWFERLVYLGLGLAVLNTYLSADELRAEPGFGSAGLVFAIVVLVITIAISLLFVWYIAYRASNVAKWIYVVLGVVGFVIMILLAVSDPTAMRASGDFSLGLTVASNLLSAVEMGLLFRRDSRDWFGGRGGVDPEIFR